MSESLDSKEEMFELLKKAFNKLADAKDDLSQASWLLDHMIENGYFDGDSSSAVIQQCLMWNLCGGVNIALDTMPVIIKNYTRNL